MSTIKRLLTGINLPNNESMDFKVGQEDITSIDEEAMTLPSGEKVLVYKIRKDWQPYVDIFWNNQIAIFYL